MRIRTSLAAVLLAAFLAAPTTASAVDWAEWRRLVRHRPAAVLVAIPPLILTSPFMGATWLVGKMTGSESGDEDDD